MKKVLPMCCILAIGTTASAQQLELLRSVVASTGGSAVLNKTIIQYTIGDVLVTTLQGPTALLTQGFQQPEVAGNNLIPEVTLVNGFIVFPNPAVNQTKLEFDLLSDAPVTIQLVNNAGQTVQNVTVNMLAGKISYALPLNSFASGLYYVVLRAGYKVYSEKLVIH